jgi:hypothetical protein
VKLLKRAGYGRANLDLLRKRILHRLWARDHKISDRASNSPGR